jgi:hypothetical protein
MWRLAAGARCLADFRFDHRRHRPGKLKSVIGSVAPRNILRDGIFD